MLQILTLPTWNSRDVMLIIISGKLGKIIPKRQIAKKSKTLLENTWVLFVWNGIIVSWLVTSLSLSNNYFRELSVYREPTVSQASSFSFKTTRAIPHTRCRIFNKDLFHTGIADVYAAFHSQDDSTNLLLPSACYYRISI